MGSLFSLLTLWFKNPQLSLPPLLTRHKRIGFGRGSQPAFDRAVHVTLPADARVLPREHDPSGGTREPRAAERIETRIEIRVPAPHPWIVVPDDRLRREQRGRTAKPRQTPDDPCFTFGRENLARLPRRVAAREKRQDARRPRLLFVAVPQRANREIGPERERTSAFFPEAALELQRRLVMSARRRVVAAVRSHHGDRRHRAD